MYSPDSATDEWSYRKVKCANSSQSAWKLSCLLFQWPAIYIYGTRLDWLIDGTDQSSCHRMLFRLDQKYFQEVKELCMLQCSLKELLDKTNFPLFLERTGHTVSIYSLDLFVSEMNVWAVQQLLNVWDECLSSSSTTEICTIVVYQAKCLYMRCSTYSSMRVAQRSCILCVLPTW